MKKKKTEKIYTIISTTIYFVVWIFLMSFIFFFNLAWGIFGNSTILDNYELLGNIVFLILPVAIICLPLLILLIFKKSMLKSIAVSFGIAIIYFILLFLCNLILIK